MLQINEDVRNVFNVMREGIIIIDNEGVIIFGNHSYCEFLNKEAGGDIGPIEGYKLQDLRPSARLPEVIQTGKALLHITRKEVEDFYLTNLYPIYRNEVLVGGISVTTFLADAYQAKEKLEIIEARNRQVLRTINKANGARYTFADIVAVSENARAVKSLAQKAAPTDAPVLLSAESGTGKELYAQAIHNASNRSHEVFVAINCANFNSNILESELFGYVEGAFTGAKKGGKMGLFEAAHGGTLFLDEVSEMDTGLQAKLLRAIQEKKIRPVGGLKEVEVDVRIICASNADLNAYIEEKKFRQDLYYRLSTFLIRIPPLRERRKDIPFLTEFLLKNMSRKLRRQISISPDAMEVLIAHDWPGNVRELRNVLEFSSYLSEDGTIVRESLPEHLLCASHDEPALTLAQRVRAFEQSEIHKTLQKNGTTLKGKQETARQLGISLATLYNKLGKQKI